MGGAPSAPAAQTVTNQPPQYVQTQAEQNMGTANYLASQPFPQYQGQLVQPLTSLQNQGIQAATNAAGAYAPALTNAANLDTNAINANPINGGATNATDPFNQNLALSNENIGRYMSPYIQQSLQPQLQQAQLNLNNQQNQTNAQATSAGAFGDARQGVENALNNYYGGQTMAGIEAQGLNTGYNTALATAQGEQNLGLQEQGVQQQQQNLGLNEQNTLLQGGNQLANLAGQYQQMGLTGANALEDAGQLQQTNLQQQLNTAYQQYLNQTQYPFQMLGVQESSITNNPYSLTNNIQLPGTSPLLSGLGSFSSLAGGLGSLLGPGGGNPSSNPFG